MKIFILKLFIFTAILAGISKCGSKDDGDISATMIENEMLLNRAQLDSLFIADDVNSDLSNWIKTSLIDYETGAPVVKYTYIKEITDSTELIYILTSADTLYNVTKRAVKPNKE